MLNKNRRSDRKTKRSVLNVNVYNSKYPRNKSCHCRHIQMAPQELLSGLFLFIHEVYLYDGNFEGWYTRIFLTFLVLIINIEGGIKMYTNKDIWNI